MLSTRCRAHLGLLAAFAVLSVSASALLIVPRMSRPVAVADVGTAAPDFALTDATGQLFHLADYQGQVVVLFFSSLDSPLSSQYNERVARLAVGYATDPRIRFFAINVRNGQGIDRLLVLQDDRVRQRSFPTLLDDKAAVATRYSAIAAPTVVVIGPHGNIRYRGPFDNNVDFAFATQHFCADAVRDALQTTAVAAAK